jgi:secreted Zn-dependent insulinase-like peptidase
MWTYDEKVAEVAGTSTHSVVSMLTLDQPDITLEDVQAFAVEYLKRLHIETLVHGHMEAKVREDLTVYVADLL